MVIITKTEHRICMSHISCALDSLPCNIQLSFTDNVRFRFPQEFRVVVVIALAISVAIVLFASLLLLLLLLLFKLYIFPTVCGSHYVPKIQNTQRMQCSHKWYKLTQAQFMYFNPILTQFSSIFYFILFLFSVRILLFVC